MPKQISEIAEHFAFALEQSGITKQAYANMEAYKNDPNARAGSDDLKTIEMLYGVRDQQDLINEYSNNIMESAHPESVIISPAYDPINGLVENNIERQNIIINIMNSLPTGAHTNRKYAQHELTMELVRLANEMDVRNKEDLFSLADECLFELNKKAIAPWLIYTGISGIVLAATWFLNHTADKDHGPISNIDRAIVQLNDLATNSWYESDVDETVQSEAKELAVHLEQLKASVTKFNEIEKFIYKPRSLSDAAELSKLTETAKEHGDFIEQHVKEFKSSLAEFMPLINQSIKNFTSEFYRNQHSKPSFTSDLLGGIADAFHGKWGLIADDFESAVNALNTVKKSLIDLANHSKNFDEVAQQKATEVEAAASEVGVDYKPADYEADNSENYEALHNEINEQDHVSHTMSN